MAEILLGVIGEVVAGYLVAPIKRQFTYMCCFNSNFKELETQLEDLKTTSEFVQMAVDEDIRKVRVVGPFVRNWMHSANEVTSEADGIIQDKFKVKEGCLNVWWCPNLKLRYSLSRKAVKKAEVVVELNADGGQYTRESYSPLPSCMANTDFSSYSPLSACTKLTDLTNFHLKMEEIIKAFTDDDINLIGVCAEYVSRTNRLVQIGRRIAEEEELFDEVGFVVVGRNPDLTNVQKCIADIVGLADLGKHDDPTTRASLRRKRLTQDNKRILLILGDIWEEFDLEDQGIPLGRARKNFKILYTSQSRHLWKDVPTKRVIIEALKGDFSGTFESRRLTMEDIIEALTGDEFKLIGICGLPGVGKTTMVLDLRNRALEERLFDEVGVVVVGQKPDLTNVQKHIADNFGLTDLGKHDDDPTARASLLRTRLSQDKKRILLILDDIWEEFDLEDQGIPLGVSHGTFKILYTSRSQRLWHHVPTKKEIAVGLLSKEEAWQLFFDKAGVLVDAPELQPVTKQIVNKCGRLPLALVIIGSTLSKKSVGKYVKDTWEDMLHCLTSSSSSSSAIESLYLKLKLSYDVLDVEAKRLFLLCCLFEEDESICIEDLARYGLGLSFFDGINGITEVRDRVSYLVDDLKKRYLLLDEDEDAWVKAHGVMRDMGIYIASRDARALVCHGDVSEWPMKDTYEHYSYISVISQKITELPEGLTCPKVEFLLLQCNEIEKLPSNFFERMEKLKVLVIYNFHGILTFPSLGNLRTLSLEGYCGAAPEFGRLPNLEILSFRSSLIKELPEELGELVKLRLLDLRYTRLLKRIPPGVISGLLCLEELYMVGSKFRDWEGEGEEEAGRNANLREFNSLSHLYTLEIHIRNNVLIPKVPIFSKLKIYKLAMQDDSMHRLLYCYGNQYKMASALTLIPSNGGEIESLLRSAPLECLASTMDLVQQASGQDPAVFPILEVLDLGSLPNLIAVWRDPVPAGSFEKLTNITVHDCIRLRNLFQRGDVHNVVTNRIEFPKLETLELEEVPSLVGFCRGIDEIDFPQLKKLILRHLPQIKGFFNNSKMSSNSEQNDNGGFLFPCPKKVTFPCLEDLKLEELPNVSHIWSNELPIMMSSFAKLKTLKVLGCGSLSNMFHPSMAGVLVNLQELVIEDCSKMEAVVDWEKEVEGQERNIDKTLFPQLRGLKLRSLPNLRRFCHFTYSLELPLLSRMYIADCSKMDAFSSGHVSAPNLSLPDVSWNGDLNNAIQPLQEKLRKECEEWKKERGSAKRKWTENQKEIMRKLKEESALEDSGKWRKMTTENQQEISRNEEQSVAEEEEEVQQWRRRMRTTEIQEEL